MSRPPRPLRRRPGPPPRRPIARRLMAALARLVVGDVAPRTQPLAPAGGPRLSFVAATPLVTGEDWRRLLAQAPEAVLARARDAAEAGQVMGQIVLARMLIAGTACDPDPDAAFRLAGAAARSGHGEALNLLGRCHEHGWGTARDTARAAVLYRAAAMAGDVWARFNLASLLFDGDGVACDRAEARVWYLRAARGGNAKAMNMLGRYCEEGWQGRVRPEAAARWFRRAAAGGDFRGQFNHARVLFSHGAREPALAMLARAVEGGIPEFCETVADDLAGSADPDLAALGARARARARAKAPLPAAGPTPPPARARS